MVDKELEVIPKELKTKISDIHFSAISSDKKSIKGICLTRAKISHCPKAGRAFVEF